MPSNAPIDDFKEAKALTKKLEAVTPFKIYPKKQLLKVFKEKGELSLTADDELEVEWVGYSGDMGGIMCTISTRTGANEVVTTSLTHVKIDPNHSLAEEVKAYQERRIRGLKLQDSRSFLNEMARLNQTPKVKKNKKSGGFRQP